MFIPGIFLQYWSNEVLLEFLSSFYMDNLVVKQDAFVDSRVNLLIRGQNRKDIDTKSSE